MKQQHTVFTLGRLVQAHQALLQFTHVVTYLLAHLVGVGQQSGPAARPAAAPLSLGSSFCFSNSWARRVFNSVMKGTSFFCRTPTLSQLEMVRH